MIQKHKNGAPFLWVLKKRVFIFIVWVDLSFTDRRVSNRTLHGSGVTLPPCLSTIGSMWSEATTGARGSAPLECLDYTADEDGVWYTVATMMYVGASQGPQHSEVRRLCVETCLNGFFSRSKTTTSQILSFRPFDRHDLCCWRFRWKPASHQHGAVWPKHRPVEHAGRYADSERRSWSGGGQWTYILLGMERNPVITNLLSIVSTNQLIYL